MEVYEDSSSKMSDSAAKLELSLVKCSTPTHNAQVQTLDQEGVYQRQSHVRFLSQQNQISLFAAGYNKTNNPLLRTETMTQTTPPHKHAVQELNAPTDWT